MAKPDEEEIEAETQQTREALEKLVAGKIAAAQPKTLPAQPGAPSFIKYTPAQQGSQYNSGASQRIIRMQVGALLIRFPSTSFRYQYQWWTPRSGGLLTAVSTCFSGMTSRTWTHCGFGGICLVCGVWRVLRTLAIVNFNFGEGCAFMSIAP
jgi:hypothetical protein